MGNEALITIEVVYAKPEEQVLVKLIVPNGSSPESAVKQSGLLARFLEITETDLQLGVFGVLCKPGYCLREGDRVEIYRPLRHDPKEARRQRALKK